MNLLYILVSIMVVMYAIRFYHLHTSLAYIVRVRACVHSALFASKNPFKHKWSSQTNVRINTVSPLIYVEHPDMFIA